MSGFSVNIDGYDIELGHLHEELRNVVENYPLFPGDTVSHRTAKACARLGWIKRQGNGYWIPTALGIDEYERAKYGGAK